jgi:hypothetical protein
MHDLLNVRTAVYPAVGAGVTTDLVDFGGGTAVVAVMNFACPVEILRFGILVDDNELLDVGAGFALALKKYLVPGSSTNAVTLGTITSTADVAKGSGLFNNLALEIAAATGDDGVSVVHVPPRDEQSNDFILTPGQQLVFEVTDSADTSGKGQVWVQYVEKPFIGVDGVYTNYAEKTA